MEERIVSIKTTTLTGRELLLHEFRVTDVLGLYACISDPRFIYPYLTGKLAVTSSPWKRIIRALHYGTICICGNKFGRLLFGARRHWIFSIQDAKSGCLLGVVMLDEVVREQTSETRTKFSDRFLKHAERRLTLRVGDGELGFFLNPEVQRQGIAIQALYVVLDLLSSGRFPVLRQVWAETGAKNYGGQRFLRNMGLIERPALAVPANRSQRFDRDGSSILLLHFDQPATDAQRNEEVPIRARLVDLVQNGLVNPKWTELNINRREVSTLNRSSNV